MQLFTVSFLPLLYSINGALEALTVNGDEAIVVVK